MQIAVSKEVGEVVDKRKHSWVGEEIEMFRSVFDKDFCIWIRIIVENQEGQWKTIIQTRTRLYNCSDPSEKFIIDKHLSNFDMIKDWFRANQSEIFKEVEFILN